MAKIYGLTGSIGMGKSAVAAMIAKMGIPLFDADAQVHRLQGPGGKALALIEARFPGTTGPEGVNRAKLAAIVLAHPHERKALEAIIHPMVWAARRAFLRLHASRPLIILDIPLLFETGRQRDVDRIIVVSAPADVQRSRALSRPGMTAEKFEALAARQVPDAEKRRQAHFIVDSSQGLDQALAQVKAIVAILMREAEAS